MTIAPWEIAILENRLVFGGDPDCYFFTTLAYTMKSRPALYPEAILKAPNLFFENLGLWLLWPITWA
jgi:hypothetical protein